MYTAIQSAIAVDFTLYKIKLLLLLLWMDTSWSKWLSMIKKQYVVKMKIVYH